MYAIKYIFVVIIYETQFVTDELKTIPLLTYVNKETPTNSMFELIYCTVIVSTMDILSCTR